MRRRNLGHMYLFFNVLAAPAILPCQFQTPYINLTILKIRLIYFLCMEHTIIQHLSARHPTFESHFWYYIFRHEIEALYKIYKKLITFNKTTSKGNATQNSSPSVIGKSTTVSEVSNILLIVTVSIHLIYRMFYWNKLPNY